MDKTPEQAAYEAIEEVVAGESQWSDAHPDTKAIWARITAAVIARARPQIEAEARAVAVEEAAKVFYELTDADADPNWPGLNEIRKRLQDLSVAPAGMVCVPVEPTQEMVSAADFSVNAETLEVYESEIIDIYKAMLAARPK